MVNVMEWQKQRWQPNNGNAEMMYVKVMTDEQLETLRRQIAVYATICERLIEMHKTISAHQDFAGLSHFPNSIINYLVIITYTVMSVTYFSNPNPNWITYKITKSDMFPIMLMLPNTVYNDI